MSEVSNAIPIVNGSATTNVDTSVETDGTLIARGYEPVVVDGKKPAAYGWRTGPVTAERIAAERAAYPPATNTGLRTGRLVGVDIDLRNPDHAEIITDLATKLLGASQLVRVGSKGKLVCYRNETPMRKITVAGKIEGKRTTLVEILGTGQQFVAYGVHPVTGKPYDWVGSLWGAEPSQMFSRGLPEVTPESIREFATRAAERLTELGYSEVKVTGDTGERPEQATPSALSGKPLSPKQIEAMLAVLPPDCDYETWRDVGGALHATDCTDPAFDTFSAFEEWSSRGDKYVGDDDCWTLWRSMPPKVGGVGTGTLIHLARAAGYTGHADGTPMEETFAGYAETLKAEHDAAEQDAELDGPIPFSDLLDRPDPGPVQELIPGLIEKGIFTLLAAPGGSHKSRLAVQWGLCIATGSPVFGRQVEQASFVYLSCEDHADEVTRRTQAITRRLKLPRDRRAAYWDKTNKPSPIAIVTEAGVELQPFYDRLRSYLLSLSGHKFLVADSAYNVLQFEGRAKIDETAVKSGLELLNRLCRETDTTMLVLWHPSQAGQERGDASGWSVAWHNTPRARLSLSPVKDVADAYDLKVEKRNNAAKGQTITLRYCEGVMLPQTEADVAEVEGRFMDACVSVALVAAENDQPFTLQKHVPTWAVNEIEAGSGRRPSQRELKEALALAVRLGRLRYQRGHSKDKAGYFPPSSPGEIALMRAGVDR